MCQYIEIFIDFFSSEEYDMEALKNVYDSFVLGDIKPPTGENPLKLSLVNNNSSCWSTRVSFYLITTLPSTTVLSQDIIQCIYWLKFFTAFFKI